MDGSSWQYLIWPILKGINGKIGRHYELSHMIQGGSCRPTYEVSFEKIEFESNEGFRCKYEIMGNRRIC